MGAGRRVTPEVRARIVELSREGYGQERIAEILRAERLADVTQSCVSKHLARARVSPAAAARASARPPVQPWAEPAPDDGADPVARLDAQIAEVATAIDSTREEANWSAYVALSKLRAQLLGQRHEMSPPPPPDPSIDPANVDARDRVVTDLTAHVSAIVARRHAQGCSGHCPRCCGVRL